MTDKETMAMALVALECANSPNGDYENEIAALKERLAQPEQEPDWKDEVMQQQEETILWQAKRIAELLDSPPQRTEQEPVELPCCGYTDASAVKWNPFNGVVQCHNCGQTYTPPQRTEQNFCSSCGKRTPDLITIHTCTPPQENT
jgi:hypothetical protein